MSNLRRSSLAITQINHHSNSALQEGDAHFRKTVRRAYDDAETIALEQLVQLKAILRDTNDDEFWLSFCQGLSRIADAQYAMIAKRIEDAPPLDTPGACLMALCWFWDNGHGCEGSATNMTYHAYSCPCALMKYDKVLLIPEKVNELFPANPNASSLVFPAEAYLAIPIMADGKCTGHFCLMWTKEALERKRLGWGFVEMLCHALEDVVLERVHGGAEFPESKTPEEDDSMVAVQTMSALQSFKPFARNLSHELRTPMQGILGTLDIMFATIFDATQTQQDPEARKIMDGLQKDIQVIQASAKRAVEASDNVVQAYALNMGLPDLDSPASSHGDVQNFETGSIRRASLRRSVSTPKINRGVKRPRDEHQSRRNKPYGTRQSDSVETSASDIMLSVENTLFDKEEFQQRKTYSPSMLFTSGQSVQRVNVRSFIRYIFDESLKTGISQELILSCDTPEGQRAEVEVRSARDGIQNKVVSWSIGGNVPEYVIVHERDMTKMLSCVFQNALKFCDSGYVNLDTTYCQQRQCVIFTVKDSGPGIPEHFRSRIFEPFAREDNSNTRHNEGLGLGLLVAKGLARKLGGDLVLVSADVSGDNKGSTFEMRIPISFNRAPLTPKSPSKDISMKLRAPGKGDLDVWTDCSTILPGTTISQPEERPRTPRHSSEPSSTTHALPNRDIFETFQLPNHGTRRPPLDPPTSPNSIQLSSTPVQAALTETLPRPTRVSTSSNNRGGAGQAFNPKLAITHPLTFLVAEDNPLNRRLLVNMLGKLGYNPATQIYEAFDGADAVRQVEVASSVRIDGDVHLKGPIDVVLMDLWMPAMDGYEATERILGMFRDKPQPSNANTPMRSINSPEGLSLSASDMKQDDIDYPMISTSSTRTIRDLPAPTILAVTADATDGASERAMSVGMEGFMVKPFRLKDLEILIREGWARREKGLEARRLGLLSC